MRYAVVVLALFGRAMFADPVSWTASPDGGTLLVHLSPVEIDSVEADGRTFLSLAIDGAATTGEPGAPALPAIRRLVQVPHGAEIRVAAEVGYVDTIRLQCPLMPRQEPVPKSGPAPAFRYDAKAYSADGAPTTIHARLADVVEVRGRRLAVVDVFPAEYEPARGVVRLARDMSVTVVWRGADWARTEYLQRRYASPAFAGRLSGMVHNAEAFATDAPPSLPVGCLIVVPDAWEANVQPLAAWRRRRGYSVFVRNLTQVGGSSAAAVKAYIQNAYDNWPIPPSFVLLVGDVDRIGYFTGGGTGNPPTDLNFACVAGADYLPDIDVSRASVANSAQLDSLVARTIAYEQNHWSNGTAWCQKAYFIASVDGGNHQVAERTHAYVMSRIRPKDVLCDSLWLYYGTGTPIAGAVNSGRAWVTYSGHGGEDCWADPTPQFDVAAVHALTNGDMVPYVQTFACVSGNFSSSTYPECFSEAWIRNGRRGAIAHIASSVNSYWTEDDTLERRVFDCMFDSGATWIMGGFNRAKLWYYLQMGSSPMTQRYLEMYNLMGDGAIDVYSREPMPLTVNHPPVVPLGAYPLRVSVTSRLAPVANALVCASSRNDTSVFAVGYTDAAGEVVLAITTLLPDSIYVTVTGHNLAPYLGAALALPSSGPYVMYLRHAVDDSAGGNSDHIINPGETINLPVWMKNWGSAPALNVRTWLRSTDPAVTVLDSLKALGDVAAGDSAYTGASGFRFAVATGCTNQYALRLTLVSRDANDSTWTSPVALFVGAPVLDYSGYRADDPPPGGNGNGMIDPGESGDLILTLRNSGMGNATGVAATLRSGDVRLQVLDSVGSFGDIPAETTASNEVDRFRVRADVSIPRETRVPCTLAIHFGGSTVIRSFDLDIGVIRACDPIPDGPRTPARYYAYDATDEAYTEMPTFSWVEIRGVGSRLSMGDDETRVVNLPPAFGPFVYYGQSYSQLSICGNGWLAPGSTSSSSYSNVLLPDGQAPGMVAACWDDLYPPAGGGVLYWYDSLERRFVVEWDSVHYYSPRTQWDKFQVVLFDSSVRTTTGDNVVLAQYLTANNYTSVTIGMDDPQSLVGINCLANGEYHRGAALMAPGMAIKYTTNPPQSRVGTFDAGNLPGRPARLALLGSAPNPFRAVTTLWYSVPREMQLRLTVFDPAGRKVTGLVDRAEGPGLHAARWDGRDAAGRRCAPGIYFYRLESGVARLVHKVVLVE